MKEPWVFMRLPKEQYGLVRKSFFEENECLDYEYHLNEDEVYLPDNFYECSENCYEYIGGTYEDGIDELKKLGFIEVDTPECCQ